nr:MAG TPA: hypothetical protein [Caudoviricetes sp.]
MFLSHRFTPFFLLTPCYNYIITLLFVDVNAFCKLFLLFC